MKHVKLFEEIELEPEVGDYVAVKLTRDASLIARLLEKHIGKILYKKGIDFQVKFGTTTWWIHLDDIVDCSKNKEDLEYYIQKDKYNL